MEIFYFHRNKKAGYSIEKSIRPVIDEIKNIHTVKEFHLPYRRSDPFSLIGNILFVIKNKSKDGINHISGECHYCIIGLINNRNVLTIHDLSSFIYTKFKLKRFILKLIYFYIPIFLTNKIICISEKTKNEILSELTFLKNSIAKKLFVIHNSLSNDYKYHPKKLNDSLKILQIGTNWNKNVENVIKACNNNWGLIIVGPLTKTQLNLLNKHNIKYSNYVNVSEKNLLNLYVDCDVVTFCSYYEGFGMPIIESQAIGRPVITSKIQPLIEISNGSSILVNPNNTTEICMALKSILNSEKYEEIVNKGLENVKRFNPIENSIKLLSIYNSFYL